MTAMIIRSLCLLFCGFVLLTGCGRDSGDASSAHVQTDDSQTANRYVTLAPAMSQILIDMGEQDQIVGIAQFDMTAAKDLPVVGNYLDINTENLLSLKPTHVLMMTGKNGTPDSLKQLAKQFDFKLMAYAYPDTIADVNQIVAKMGVALQMEEKAFAAGLKMQNQLVDLFNAVAEMDAVRVLPVIGTDPVMASGSNSVIDEMIRWIGAINVAGNAPVSAPTYDREKLVTLNPDVILLLMPDAPALVDGLADPRLSTFVDLPINAVKNKRIVLINDPLTFLPATTLPRIVRQIALAIDPQLAETVSDAK